jgi:hypothetical protein
MGPTSSRGRDGLGGPAAPYGEAVALAPTEAERRYSAERLLERVVAPSAGVTEIRRLPVSKSCSAPSSVG